MILHFDYFKLIFLGEGHKDKNTMTSAFKTSTTFLCDKIEKNIKVLKEKKNQFSNVPSHYQLAKLYLTGTC